jgi:hypothetical protein
VAALGQLDRYDGKKKSKYTPELVPTQPAIELKEKQATTDRRESGTDE